MFKFTKAIVSILALVPAAPSEASDSKSAGKWGLNSSFLVENCLTQKKCEGPLKRFRGRSNQTMGSAAIVIWKVGTKRIVAWGAATESANNVIKDKMDFSYTLYADFFACPMEDDIPGHRIEYCVESIKNIRWEKNNY